MILRKGLKIRHDEIGEGKECQRNGEDEKAMDVARLKDVGNGWNDISEMDGEENFSKAAVDKSKRRDGVGEDNDEG